jgi:hypothetical protein
MSASLATKLMHLYLYKINMVYELQHRAKLHFLNWQFFGVYLGETDPRVILFNEQAQLMSGATNSQNNRFPILVHKAPLHDVMAGVECAIHAPRNIWTIFFLVCSVLQVQLGLLGPYLT